MSDISAAAAALSIPEDLVTRSASARAAADGTSTDEIISAWASGGSAPATTPASDEEPPPVDEEVASSAAPVETTEPAPGPETAPAPSQPESVQPRAATIGPAVIPVLEGRRESPVLVAGGAAALLLVALLIGFLAPALPQEGNGVYTSAVPLSQAGIDGREVYRSEGCSSCHTQVVRPIVTDIGLGPVTISDTNQVLGSRRYGPDLSHIGGRVESQSSLLTVLTNSGAHQSYAGLSDDDLENLTAYLFQSK